MAEAQLSLPVSAEVRKRIAVSPDLTGQRLAARIGRSQNYVATRLRDERPFTLDDLEAIASVLEISVAELIAQARRSSAFSERAPERGSTSS